jgi:chromosomal replication initiator protein
MDSWDAVRERVRGKVSQEAYENWFARTQFLSEEAGHIRVLVDPVTKSWIETEYAPVIRDAVQALNFRSIEFETAGTGLPAQVGSNGSAPTVSGGGSLHQAGSVQPIAHEALDFSKSQLHLNPKFSFENFVVGSSNQFAHAAAKAVAKTPSRSYNPLFIYGGTGLGKTHLMHAIGRTLEASYPSLRVAYTTAERFMNEMIHCIRGDRMNHFQKHYRSADVLLVDDIHVIAGKERTQEEFFHTFNELYDHQKQIVISSDSAPKNTPGLVERLRSRFEWGLMVDIQPPDLETKMAILDKKAADEGVDLPEDVRVFVATKTKTSVRELEGALVKLIAFSSVSSMPISLGMAQQVLKHLMAGPDRRINMDAIVKAVAERFNITPAQLKMKSNSRQIAYPRQIAMFLVRELTQASLPEIGRYFAGKHHTTVLHSINKIEQLKQTDMALNRMLQSIADSLQA